jgi:hypothetical protein
VESVRRTLFCVDACEGLLPCQGSIAAAEAIEDEEDCKIGGVDRPDCRCGNAIGGVNRPECRCRNAIGGVGWSDCGCSGNAIGGVDRSDCRCSRNAIGGVENPCEDVEDVEEEDCFRNQSNCAADRFRRRCRPENDVLGSCDMSILKRLLGELCGEVARDDCDDDRVGPSAVRCASRSAFRNHGSNGCSW